MDRSERRHGPRTNVTSSTTTEQEIWIRRDGGEETVVKLFDVEVPVREGQKVTVIGARRPGAKDGFWLNFVNHSANRHWRLNTNSEASGQGRLGAEPLLRWYDWVIAILLGRLVAVPYVTQLLRHLAPSSALELTIGLPFLYLAIRRLWRAHRRNRIFAALDAWVERGAQTTYSAERKRAGGTVRSEAIA